MQSANRNPLAGQDALQVLEGVTHLFVAKGKKTLHFDLTETRPADAELLELLLGRSGKLRAPSIRKGTHLLVGYNEDILRVEFTRSA